MQTPRSCDVDDLIARRRKRMAASKSYASSKRFSSSSETGSYSMAGKTSVCSGASSLSGGCTSGASSKRRKRRCPTYLAVAVLGSAAATGLGMLTFQQLSLAERRIAKQQWHSMAQHGMDAALRHVEQTYFATWSMATLMARSTPPTQSWPFVTLTNFDEWSAMHLRSVVGTIKTNSSCPTTSQAMLFSPFVDPDEVADFESFASATFATQPNGGTTTSLSHDAFNSSHEIMAPIVQYYNSATHANVATQSLLGNLYSDKAPRQALDAMIECDQRRLKHDESSAASCAQLTSFLDESSSVLPTMSSAASSTSATQSLPLQPLSLVMHPIYPASAKNATKATPQLAGVVASTLVWSNVLSTAFAVNHDGRLSQGKMYCVLKADDFVVTFSLDKGVVSFLGEGNFHDARTDALAHSRTISDHISVMSPSFTLTLYPATEGSWTTMYATSNPLLAAIGAAALVVLSCILFVLYNIVVCRKFNAKARLLDAKRKYMRFISHEVRTPLNSLCLGLTLLRDEMSATVGASSSSSSSDGPASTGVGGSGSGSLRGLWKRPATSLTLPSTSPPATTALAAATTADAGDNPTAASSEKVNEWLVLTKEVLRNASSAVGVLSDLLQYDKIEMGQLNLELTVVPIADLIRRTSEEFNLQAAKKKIHFHVHFATPSMARPCNLLDEENAAQTTDLSELRVIGDKVRIAQCLRNLISNALKFTDEGGSVYVQVYFSNEGTGTATSRRRSSHDKIRSSLDKFTLHGGEEVVLPHAGFIKMSVTDTGAGMSQDQLDGLFRDGVQFNVNKLQAGQGSGLGLFITKGILEQHGGSVKAHSEGIKKGSTFTMTLPLHTTTTEKAATSVEAASSERYLNVTGGADGKELEPHSLRILVVDDSDMNRKLLSRLLQSHGHQCDQAVDGLEAVKMVEKARDELNPYDTILLDYEMPIMNGPTAAHEIRQLGCDSFVVGITGNILPEDVAHFKSCGADGVLPKPFRLADLEDLWVEHGVNGVQLDPR